MTARGGRCKSEKDPSRRFLELQVVLPVSTVILITSGGLRLTNNYKTLKHLLGLILTIILPSTCVITIPILQMMKWNSESGCAFPKVTLLVSNKARSRPGFPDHDPRALSANNSNSHHVLIPGTELGPLHGHHVLCHYSHFPDESFK